MPTIPRLPFVPDPLRRVRIPSDLRAVTTTGAEADPEAVGLSPRTVNRIWAAARNLYKSGVHPALQLCLRRNGQIVLDRAIGHARGNGPDDPPDAPKVLATPDTPFCVFSTSKAITAMVIHVLHERGALSIYDRVTDYIPEYGRHGKGETTIAHVLSHRAGVPTLPRKMLDIENVADRELINQMICDAKPFVKPGTLLAYHAISGGFILGEIVQRVTGRSIREVLAESILDPLHFRWTNYGVRPEEVDQGRALLRHRAAAAATPLEYGGAGAEPARGRGGADLQRSALSHRDHPRRQPHHHGQRALALLRDHARRRRA